MIGKTNAVIGGGGSGVAEITFTVEGAKGDNISIIDYDDVTVGNIIFDTNATSAEHTMFIPATGMPYTFASSVAKDIETSVGNYAKKILLTKDTDSVKVYPTWAENNKETLLWGGCELTEFGLWQRGGTSSYTFSQNSGYTFMDCPRTNIVMSTAYQTKASIDLSQYNSIHILAKATLGNRVENANARLFMADSYGGGDEVSYTLLDFDNKTYNGILNHFTWNISDVNTSKAIGIYITHYSTSLALETYALWLE